MTYRHGMTDNRLTRQRSILRLIGSPPDVSRFVTTLDQDEDPPTIRTWDVPRADWEDMGRPSVITLTVEPGDALNDLAGARTRVTQAETDLIDQVREARRNGKSWADVAAVFGISRQAAHARFTPYMAE